MSVRLFEKLIPQCFFLKETQPKYFTAGNHTLRRDTHAHTEYLSDMSDGEPDQGK